MFGRVRLVERGAPQSLPLMESGKVRSADTNFISVRIGMPKMFLLYQQILPGVRVIIVNPETRGPLGDSHLGEVRGSCERASCSTLATSQSQVLDLKAAVSQSVLHFQIWVNSPHNASGYYTIYGEESLQANHFNTKLSFGDPLTLWARTGYLGFVKRTELLDASGGK